MRGILRSLKNQTHSVEQPPLNTPSLSGGNILVALLCIIAIASLVWQAASPPAEKSLLLDVLDIFMALAFVALWLLELGTARSYKQAIIKRRVEIILTLMALISIAVLSALSSDEGSRIQISTLAVARVFLFASVTIQALRLLDWIISTGLRPEIILVGTFAFLIAISSTLLALPGASANPAEPITPLEALFTATSAACVTGLIVRDTGSDFTTFGHIVILASIQFGGLGLITFVALLSSLSSRSLPVPQMVIFRHIMSASETDDLRRRVAGIFLFTLLVQTVGAAILFFSVENIEHFGSALKWAVFHSISAFCNAGFSLEKDSLEAFRNNIPINLTVILLTVIGSLGFLVIPELLARAWKTITALLPFRKIKSQEFFWPRLSNQTRLSLITTGFLLAFGTILFWLCEQDSSLRNENPTNSFLAALFHASSTRTSGFNTIPVGELAASTLFLMILLMVIGGCPVSTAGGIKTVTVSILALCLRSVLLGRQKIEAFGRTLPQSTIVAATNVLLAYFVCAWTGLFILTITEPSLPFEDLMFETISALSTVGLSTGITTELSPIGKITLCLLMFIGRVGPLALALSVFQSHRRLDYDLPEEDVVVS